MFSTDHLPERLRGNPTRLAQALINLLSRAVKFTQRGLRRLRGELLREEGPQRLVRFELRHTVRASRPTANSSCSRPSNRLTARPPGVVPAWAAFGAGQHLPQGGEGGGGAHAGVVYCAAPLGAGQAAILQQAVARPVFPRHPLGRDQGLAQRIDRHAADRGALAGLPLLWRPAGLQTTA